MDCLPSASDYVDRFNAARIRRPGFIRLWSSMVGRRSRERLRDDGHASAQRDGNPRPRVGGFRSREWNCEFHRWDVERIVFTRCAGTRLPATLDRSCSSGQFFRGSSFTRNLCFSGRVRCVLWRQVATVAAEHPSIRFEISTTSPHVSVGRAIAAVFAKPRLSDNYTRTRLAGIHAQSPNSLTPSVIKNRSHSSYIPFIEQDLLTEKRNSYPAH